MISSVVVPRPAANEAMFLALAIGVPVYVAAALVVGVAVGTVTSVRALRWVYAEEPPDDAERTRTLRVPVRLTVLQFVLWAGATVVFTLLAVALQPERALGIGLTVGTASIVVSGVAYLLSDFALRPIAARALVDTRLTDRPRGVGIRSRAVIFWAVGTGAPVVALVLSGILALTDSTTNETRLAVTTIVVGGVVLVFGLLVTVLASGAVRDPVVSVRDRDARRRAGPAGPRGGDLRRLRGRVAAGRLQPDGGRAARAERLRDLFGRHVGREVARRAASALGEVELGGESRVASVLFVDLEGSTAYATEHDPAEVVAMLNRFFGVVVDEVDERGGLVNKFIGDAVLAVFGRRWSSTTTRRPRSARRGRSPRGSPRSSPSSASASGSPPATWWPATWATRSATSTRSSATP